VNYFSTDEAYFEINLLILDLAKYLLY